MGIKSMQEGLSEFLKQVDFFTKLFSLETFTNSSITEKQPSTGVLRKRCSENMQQIYRRTPMSKCEFNKVALHFVEISLWHGCSPVNLLHIFRTPF